MTYSMLSFHMINPFRKRTKRNPCTSFQKCRKYKGLTYFFWSNVTHPTLLSLSQQSSCVSLSPKYAGKRNFMCFRNLPSAAKPCFCSDQLSGRFFVTIIFKNASAFLPEAISDGGLTPTTDTDLLLATYRGGSHLTSDIFIVAKNHVSSYFNLT